MSTKYVLHSAQTERIPAQFVLKTTKRLTVSKRRCDIFKGDQSMLGQNPAEFYFFF